MSSSKKIKIHDQDYLKIILKKNPNLRSGRKNYNLHYKRILKNLLLTKHYTLNNIYDDDDFYNKLSYLKKGNDLHK